MARSVLRRPRVPAAALALRLALHVGIRCARPHMGDDPRDHDLAQRRRLAALAVGTGASMPSSRRRAAACWPSAIAVDGCGVTWSASTAISTADAVDAYGEAIASRGTTVDASWVEFTASQLRLRYRRSIDGGVTWQAPVSLSTGAIATAGTAAVTTVVEGTYAPAAAVAPTSTSASPAGRGAAPRGASHRDTIPDPSPSSTHRPRQHQPPRRDVDR